jgi:hypothetical protein
VTFKVSNLLLLTILERKKKFPFIYFTDLFFCFSAPEKKEIYIFIHVYEVYLFVVLILMGIFFKMFPLIHFDSYFLLKKNIFLKKDLFDKLKVYISILKRKLESMFINYIIFEFIYI